LKIVFITSRFPYPLEKGDKLRAYHHIIHLSSNHEIILIALCEHPVPTEHMTHLKQFCSGVHIFVIPRIKRFFLVLKAFLRGESLQIGYFFSPRLKAKIEDLILDTDPDHIFCQLIRPAPYVALLPFPKTLDYMDVFSVGMRQRAERASPFLKPFYYYEADKLASAERSIYKYFDSHCIISAQDRERLPLTYSEAVTVLPNGVDPVYFAPAHKSPEYDIVFVGNMGYLPNIEAAEYLVKQVMPHVWEEKPESRVLIAGARPHRRVRAMESGRVNISGWVEDIRDAYAAGKVFVGAIFSGIGQQNKILEAMAMELPCVTSSIVNNAIGATHKQHLLVANDALSFAKSVISLLEDDETRMHIGGQARQFIIEHYQWEQQNKTLDKLFYHEQKDPSKMILAQ
jgi:sugar transferase (PEP-CTERM/EpsH1 system associated)